MVPVSLARSGNYRERHGRVFDARDDLFGQLGSFEDTWKGKTFELLYGSRRSV
jgi:hypothetical protein